MTEFQDRLKRVLAAEESAYLSDDERKVVKILQGRRRGIVLAAIFQGSNK
jgi:hypothetical protein